MKKPKIRIIYDNYNLKKSYPDDDLREELAETQERQINEITDNEIEEERYFLDYLNWQNIEQELAGYFSNGNHFIAVGTVGRWNGTFAGGKIFETLDELLTIAKDCDYLKFYDENGHLYLKCSHHDGTNEVEIKEITEKGWEYYENWNYGGWDDRRTEEYIHRQIFIKYSKLPNFAHKYYGCKLREYEEVAL